MGGMVWYCGRCVRFIHTKLHIVFPCNFVPLLVLQVILQVCIFLTHRSVYFLQRTTLGSTYDEPMIKSCILTSSCIPTQAKFPGTDV